MSHQDEEQLRTAERILRNICNFLDMGYYPPRQIEGFYAEIDTMLGEQTGIGLHILKDSTVLKVLLPMLDACEIEPLSSDESNNSVYTSIALYKSDFEELRSYLNDRARSRG